MSKICPQCNSEFDDNQCFCSNCGSKLIDNLNISTPHLNLGDANAISGGVKIDQSKTVMSHDTHYHSTIVEKGKSEAEVRLDAINQIRTKAEETMAERGRIDSVAISELRKLSLKLGISDEHFKSIH